MTGSWAFPPLGGPPPACPHRSHVTGFHSGPRLGRGTTFRQATGVERMLCTVVAIDLARSGQTTGDDVLCEVRDSMYRIVETAFDEAQVSWADCEHEGRGDTVIVAAAPYVPTEMLLDDFVIRLRAGLRLHNKLSSEIAMIRFRMTVHVGPVTFSPRGMTGHTIDRLTDLLDAPDFAREFAESSTDLGIVASDYLWDELIRYGPGLIDPTAYHLIKVPTGYGNTCGWMHFPSQPVP